MKEEIQKEYVKRSQKDYSMSFVQEVKQGLLSASGARSKYGAQGGHTVEEWLKNFGNFAWENKSPFIMEQTPQQRKLALEQGVCEAYREADKRIIENNGA